MARKNEIAKARRLALGWTIGELAAAADISGSTISRYEAGYEVSRPFETAIWAALDRARNSMQRDEYCAHEIKVRALTLELGNTEAQINNLTYIIKSCANLIAELNNKH